MSMQEIAAKIERKQLLLHREEDKQIAEEI